MATVLITGANRGIGLCMAQQYQQRGDKVIALCRNASTELQALGVEIHEGIDLSDDKTVDQLAVQLGETRIDIVINNAGILLFDQLGELDFDNIRRQFTVNTLGPLYLSRALLPNLHGGSKLVFISSRVGSLEDNGSGNNYGYRMSKVALNMAAVNLAHDLRERDIAVLLLHPGHVKTEMTRYNGLIEPDQAAANLIRQIDSKGMAETGTFWHAEGYALPW